MNMKLRSYTPLRYPGGKARLYNYVKEIIQENNLQDYIYTEPFAGGGGLALKLLITGVVNKILINDKDRSIHAFWYSILNYTDEFLNKIDTTDITLDEWYKQKEIQSNKETASLLELGFSTFFLNRTNHSGIIKAGPIGGYTQAGNYKIDCRFKKELLKNIINIIASHKSNIILANQLDAIDLLDSLASNKYFIYLDPPYYNKGYQLYMNYFKDADHKKLFNKVSSLDNPWIVSYDKAEFIENLYADFKSSSYELIHNVSNKGKGTEIMFFSPDINIPKKEQ